MKKFGWVLFSTLLSGAFFGPAEISSGPLDDYAPAPNFTVKDLDGNDLSLSDYRGNVVFLNFWATWCPPCREEIPGFTEVYKKYKAKGLVILGISLDRAGEDKIRRFVQEYKITYPVARGSLDLASEYQAGRVIPETVIIDKQGKIRHKHVGYMDKQTLEKYFLELSGEK